MHLCFFFYGKCLKVLIIIIFFIRVAATIAINFGLCSSLPDPLIYTLIFKEGNIRVNVAFVFCLFACLFFNYNKLINVITFHSDTLI